MEPGKPPPSQSGQRGSTYQVCQKNLPLRKRTAPMMISTPPPSPPQPSVPPPQPPPLPNVSPPPPPPQPNVSPPPPPPQPNVPPPPLPPQPNVPPQQREEPLLEEIKIMGFSCPICNVFQPGRDGLEKHFSHKKGTVGKKCVRCRRTFDPKNELIFELRKYTYFCPACKTRFKTGKSLEDHMKPQLRYMKQDFHECKICKRVIYLNEKKAHYEKEHGREISVSPRVLAEKPLILECALPQNPTTSSAGATGAAASASQTPPKTSQASSAQSSVPPSKQADTTTQAKKGVCSKCNDGPDRLEELCAHVLDKTPMPDRCMDCRETDYAAFRRRVHFPLPKGKLSPKDESKPCPVCNAVLYSSLQLASHWDSHKAEEDLDCVGCNAKFTLCKFYKIHFNIHAKKDMRHVKLIVPFKCRESSCESSRSAGTYNDVQPYVQHMLQDHQKEFPFQCPFPECKVKSSFDEDLFSRHLTLVHFADAAHYRCIWCQQLFEREKDWKEHKKDMQHEGKPYQCNMCPYFFDKFNRLKNHMMKKHPLY